MRVLMVVALTFVVGLGVGYARATRQAVESLVLRDGSGRCIELSIRTEWPLIDDTQPSIHGGSLKRVQMMLDDDVCDCGVCAWETCDYCAGPSERLDDEGTSFCARCWRRLVDEAEPSRDWLDRQMGLEPMSASEEARYYQRMKGEHTGW